MIRNYRPLLTSLLALVLALAITACREPAAPLAQAPGSGEAVDERGPHNGRLLRDGDFQLELAIFETGVPPEYRAWATVGGEALTPAEFDLNVQLTRLGGIVDEIGFAPQGDALRGDSVIYEPHSFSVAVTAIYNGNTYRWAYDSFEGRTRIEPAVQAALEIGTEIAGPAVVVETLSVHGRIVANTDRISHVQARFDGRLSSVTATLGERVTAGTVLAEVESNQSFTISPITAPIAGLITQRNAGPGEQTAGRELFTITDTSTVWADLAVFPADLPAVQLGAAVTLRTPGLEQPLQGVIARFLPATDARQAVTARVVLANPDGQLRAGSWVSARIEVARHEVPLAVRREGLQAFRDFTVVYAQIGDEFEVRMLELGRESEEWVEVLGGLAPGTRYVTRNSYILKADVEKDGASHDH